MKRKKNGEYRACLKYSVPNNTGTKQVSIMKQTAFWREKNGEYTACLKYSVPTFVEQISKIQLWRLAVWYDLYIGRWASKG